MLTKEQFDKYVITIQNKLLKYNDTNKKYAIEITSGLYEDMLKYVKQNYKTANDICNILDETYVNHLDHHDNLYAGYNKGYVYRDGLFSYFVSKRTGKVKHITFEPSINYSQEYATEHMRKYGNYPGFKYFIGYIIDDDFFRVLNIVERAEFIECVVDLGRCI